MMTTVTDMLWVLVGLQFAALFAAAASLLYFKRALRHLIADREAAERELLRKQQERRA